MYEELVKSLRNCADAACNGCKNELVQIGCRGKLQREAADAIEELQKKVSGEWIEEESGWDDIYYTCSVCGDAVCTIDGTTVEDNGWNYCPTCGARMIGIKRLPEPPKEKA